MKKQVLFIQGAGEGAYAEDKKLAVSLQDALGTEYQVLYPQMPNEEDPGDKAWIAQISKELASVDDNAILVGHSAGGAVLLKYFKECRSSFTIAATMNGCPLPTWQCIQKEFHKQPFVNSTAVGISSITICLKLRRI